MTANDRITAYIHAHQLASAMNKTKWRKLAAAMTSNCEFEPRVRLRHLFDEGPVEGFTLLDWEWMKGGDTDWVEWLEIDPIRHDYVGRLVDDRSVDFTDWVRQALVSQSIPFEEADGFFKVRGYIRPNP